MEWPARSPDLNPIENLEGWIVRQVYAHNRQFSNLNELWNLLVKVWDNIPDSFIKFLIDSIQSCVLELLEKGGATTYYQKEFKTCFSS